MEEVYKYSQQKLCIWTLASRYIYDLPIRGPKPIPWLEGTVWARGSILKTRLKSQVQCQWMIYALLNHLYLMGIDMIIGGGEREQLQDTFSFNLPECFCTNQSWSLNLPGTISWATTGVWAGAGLEPLSALDLDTVALDMFKMLVGTFLRYRY